MSGAPFGQAAGDVGHVLGGAVLVLSFTMLYQRRVSAVINAYALQAAALAAAAAWQGWAWQGGAGQAPRFFLLAAVTLGVKGVLLPLALRRIVRRRRLRRAVEAAPGVFPSMVLGVALVALAVLLVLPIAPSAAATRETLALALSVVLLGLLVMVTRRNAPTQVVGFLSLENGLALAVIGASGMEPGAELLLVTLALAVAVVLGTVLLRVRERFDGPDAPAPDAAGDPAGEAPR